MSQPTPTPLLSETQRKITGFALTFISVAAIIGLVCLSILATGRILSHFSGVLWPLLTALIVALVLRPAVDFLERRLKVGRTTAVCLLFAAFLLAAAGLLAALLPPLIGQIADFIGYAPQLWSDISVYVEKHFPEWIAVAKRQLENPTIRQVADSLLAELKDILPSTVPSLKAAGGGVLSAFGFLSQLLIVPVYLFFFLLSRAEPSDRLGDHLPFLRQSLREDLVFLVREFVSVVVSFFRGQLLIGLIMGLMLALGFSVVGLRFGLLLGLACGLLNIIPYLGTIAGLLTALPIAFLQPGGGWGLVGLVIIVKVIVQNIEGWYLTPRIMGHRTGLHPAAIIFSLFFWGAALGGLLGMILAIPLSAFFVTAWRLVRHKYLEAARTQA